MERVTIKIEVNVDDRQLDALLAKLAALESQSKLTGKSFGDLTANTTKLDDSVNKNSKSMSQMSDRMKKADKSGNILTRTVKNFTKILSGLAKFTLKAFLINLALATASILAVNAAFALGSLTIRAYKASLNVLAAAAAAVVTALSAAAAGQREYNAAMQATKYGGMQNAMAQLRTINTNTQLAVLGAESLNAAFAGISEKARMTGGLNKALTALGDFAVASGQADKAMGAAGKFLGELASSGKLTRQIADMAAGVGPQFQKAVTEWRKKHGDATYQEFINALNAGELSTEVAGALDNVNQTLFGAFKRNFQLIKEQFADMGQPLLPKFTEAINRIARILQVTLLRIQANMQMFARGSFLDGLVGTFEKISNWTVKTFNEDLPKAIGMIDRLRDRFRGVGETFKRIGAALEPLREGSRVLQEAFGPFVRALFTEFGQGVKDLSDLFVKNRSGLIEFGESLKTLLESIGDLFGEIKKAIVQSLPTLSKLVNVLAQIVGLITALVGGFNSMGEGGSVGMLIGLATLGLAMKGGKGGRGGAGGGGMGLLRGGMGAGGGGSWLTRAGTAGGAIGTLAAIGLPLAGNYASNEGSRSGFGTAGMLGAGALMLGSMGKLPFYSKIMKSRMPAGMYGPPKPVAAQSSMGGALAYAAPVMAGAIGGGFTSDLVLSRYGKGMSTGGVTAAGVGAGALGGAAAGAATGAIIGAFGGPIGAGVGALLGVVGGAVVGFINSGKMKKKARKQAEEFVGNYDNAIEQALQSGDALAAQKLLEQMKSQSEAQAAGSKQTDAFNKKYKELEKQLEGKVQPAVELYNKTLNDLSGDLGVGKKKIEELAKSLGLNLVTDIEKVRAAILGLDPSEMNLDAMRGMFFETMTDVFNKPIALQEMQQAITSEDIRIRQIIDELGAEAVSQADIGKYLQTALGYETQFTGDPFKAFGNIYKKLTSSTGGMYQSTGIFAGAGETLAPEFKQQLDAAFGELVSGKALTSAAAAISGAATDMFGVKGTTEEIRQALIGRAQTALTGNQADKMAFLQFMSSVTGAGVTTDKDATRKAFEAILGDRGKAMLGGYDAQQNLYTAIAGADGLTGKIIALTNGLENLRLALGLSNVGLPATGLSGTVTPSGIPTPTSTRTVQSAIPLPGARAAYPTVTYGGDTNTFIINGGDASEEKIAQAVMNKLMQRDRNKKERK